LSFCPKEIYDLSAYFVWWFHLLDLFLFLDDNLIRLKAGLVTLFIGRIKERLCTRMTIGGEEETSMWNQNE
jgi:hypothetical protein